MKLWLFAIAKNMHSLQRASLRFQSIPAPGYLPASRSLGYQLNFMESSQSSSSVTFMFSRLLKISSLLNKGIVSLWLIFKTRGIVFAVKQIEQEGTKKEHCCHFVELSIIISLWIFLPFSFCQPETFHRNTRPMESGDEPLYSWPLRPLSLRFSGPASSFFRRIYWFKYFLYCCQYGLPGSEFHFPRILLCFVPLVKPGISYLLRGIGVRFVLCGNLNSSNQNQGRQSRIFRSITNGIFH